MRQIYLDVETTGFSSKEGNILQFAAVVYENGELVQEYNQYFHPQYPIHARAEEVHGISEADVAAAPDFSEHAADLQELLAGAELIGHNIAFDKRFLNEEFARAGLKPLEDIAGKITCTMELAREKYPLAPSHKLSGLAEHFELGAQQDQHDAYQDVQLTRKLHEVLARAPTRRRERSTPTLEVQPAATPTEKELWEVGLTPPALGTAPMRWSNHTSTLEYDAALIHKLIERLQGNANMRSGQLNARVGESNTRLDLADLDAEGEFLTQLLTKENFKIEITLPPPGALPPAAAPGN